MQQTKTWFYAILFTLTGIVFSNKINAQETCGFENLMTSTYSDSLSKTNFDSIRSKIRARVAIIQAQDNPYAKIQQNNYVIPVVVHLVGTNAVTMTDAQVVAQINLLNAAFSNTLGSSYSSSDDAQIKFCLAQNLPSGAAWSNISTFNSNLYYNTTAGITRCTTTVANSLTIQHDMSVSGPYGQQALVNIAYGAFNSNNYLNIWVVEQISELSSPYLNYVVGYAPFPIMGSAAGLDGIVMRLNGFGINSGGLHYNQGRTLVHETGHYLGLFHTFQNGCAGTTTATCYSAGDECCDTPPVLSANQTSCSVLASSPPSSCGVPDMYENHMDYAYDMPGTCRNTFTNDQADRMHATIQLYRSTLVSYSNHIFTGLTNPGGCQAGAISPIFATNLPLASKQICVGQSIGFSTGSSASTYTWTFSGATPSVAVGTYSPTGIVYSSAGIYSVTLNITDGSGNNYNSTMQVFVSNCSSITGSRANWYFGNNASVSFSTGIALSQPSPSMTSLEESASVSDASGNLLFYTNGRSVYNRAHSVMTNGNNTLNTSINGPSPTSAAQGVVIVPKPGNANSYYIYTTSDAPYSPTANVNYGISQYEVVMTTTVGTVTSTVPVNPSQNYAMNEPIVAIPHCNGTDYWVCAKPRNNNQNGLLNGGPTSTVNLNIASYLVTSSGISNIPVLSSSGSFTPSSTFAYSDDGIANIAVSPDKSLICFGYNRYGGLMYLYNFDCSSGKLNYIATVPGSLGYGLAFSPNSKVLYAMYGIGDVIRQYDLSQFSVCNPNPPYKEFTTGYNGGSGYGALQLGPDNRIYCAHREANFLSAINFPNNLNSSNSSNECGFNYAAIPLNSPAICKLGLPNDIIGQAGQTPDDFSFCLSNCGQAKFTNLGCGSNFAWNFGDGYAISGTNTVIPGGTNGGTTTGNYEYPVHTYSSPGTYIVTLSIDGRSNVTHTVVISTAPTPTITGSDIICVTNTTSPVSYYAPVGYTYSWGIANGTPSVSTQQNVDISWVSFPGVLTLTITNSSGCSAASSLSVYVSSSVAATASPSTVCPTAPTSTLFASGTASYTWQPVNITGNTAIVTPTATTIYTLTGLTAISCSITKTVQVTVSAAAGPTISVNSATVCAGTPTVLTASGANAYNWSNGATTNSISVSPPSTTIYTVTGTNTVTGCGARKTATVTVKPTPTVTVSSNPITICSGASSTLSATGATTYSWSTGATTSSISVTPGSTSNYTVVGTNSVSCSNTKIVSVIVNASPTVAVSGATICAGSTAILTASGAPTYSWNTGVTTASISLSPTVTTTYSITGTNTVTACFNTKAVSVTVNALPSLTISATPSTICTGKPSTLTASGAATYTWMPGSLTYSTVGVYPTSNTTYTCTGTSSAGCINSKTLTVTVNPLPTVTAVANPTLICSSQSSTLTAGGATSYTWNTGATTVATNVTPTITTTYSVTGSNANGCINTKTVTVNVIPYTPLITASATAVAVCGSGSSTVTASGASTYTWSTTSNSSTIAVTPTVATVYAVSGNYSITGCGTGSTTIVVNPVISTLCCSAASSTVGTSLTSSVSFPSGSYTVSGTVIDMQGVITFTGSTSFTGYTFRMKPGTLLKVHTTADLTLQNCKLFSCSELWDGIRVLNDGTYFGSVKVDGTTVEDMYNGIVADYNGNAVGSSSVAITGSTLNKNYITLQILNSSGVTGHTTKYPLTINTSTFTSYTSNSSPGSTLKPSSTYTYAYNQITNGSDGTSAPYINFPRAFTAIVLNNLGSTHYVLVGDSAVTGNTNTFDNLDFGITGTEVTLKVHNNYFKNITGDSKQGGPLGDPSPAAGPDEIGIAVAMTHTSTNVHKLTVGTHTVIPSSSPYPKGNIFEDCYKGIKALNCKNVYAKANTFTASTTSTIVVTSCCGGIVIPNPNTYYFYKGLNGIWVSSLTDNATLSYNYVRNYNNCIYTSYTAGSSSVTIGIQKNDIKAPSTTGYCNQAILVGQAGGSNLSANNLSITDNGIKEVYGGISATSVGGGLYIYKNDVTIENTTKTYASSATSPRNAITASYCSYGLIKGNTVSSNASSVPTNTTTAKYLNGIQLNNSSLGKVECNLTDNLGRDFVFTGNCANTWLANTMQNSCRGLELYSNGVIGIQGALTYSVNPNLSANTWTNMTQETYVTLTPGSNTLSPLYVKATGTIVTAPTLNFGQATQTYSTGLALGIRVTTGVSYTCNAGSAQRMANGNDDNTYNNQSGGFGMRMTNDSTVTDTLDMVLFNALATNTEADYEAYPEEFVYHNKQQVYKLMQQDSITDAESTTLMENFFTDNQHTSINALTEVQQALANNDVNLAQSINTTVAPDNTVEQKHKRMNELTIYYLNDTYYNFSAQDRQDIRSMANECIIKGAYVAQARLLLNHLTNQIINYTDECNDENMNSRKAKTSTNSDPSTMSFLLFPNPNNGNMQMDYDLNGYNNATMNLYDVTGKVVNTYNLNDSKGTIIMNEQNLHNGIYFYHILVNGKSIKNDKIVIIK